MKRNGFALLGAITLAMLLSAIALATARTARSTIAVADGILSHAAAAAAADAAIWRVAMDLSGPVGTRRVEWEGHEVAVEWRSESVAVDLNRAPADALRLVAAQSSVAAPDAFAAAVLARRTAFAASGISWHLGAQAFDTVAEAKSLADRDAWPRLAGYLTIGPRGEGLWIRAVARAPGGAVAEAEARLAIDDPAGLRVNTWRHGRS